MDRILRVLSGGARVAILAAALVAGWANTLSAGDVSVWPGPNLSGPAEPTKRLATDDPPTADTPAENTPERSLQLEQIAQQADRQTRHGCELAGRGAHFAARAEFLAALRLVAEGLDTEQKTGTHARALAAALVAIREAEDFLPGGPRLEADFDLPDIVAVHATPVLKDDAEKTTPLTALRSYLTFAQEQFAAAAEHEVAGSMALHAMGKLHVALARKKGTPIVAPESKAVVFYQAALLVRPKNFMAANGLGVLLAQCGRYGDARTMLEHSVSLCPQSTGWQNLAVVYRQLGEAALAQRAAGQATLLLQRDVARRKASPTVANDRVRWIDPQTFARTSTSSPNAAMVTALPPVVKPQAVGASVAKPHAAFNAYQPAPTPAAAQRRSWASPAYQR